MPTTKIMAMGKCKGCGQMAELNDKGYCAECAAKMSGNKKM